MNRGKLLLLVGPVVLIVGLYFATSGSGSVSLSTSLKVVDVTTGKVTTLPTGKGLVLPATNKEGEVVLYPVVEDESGRMVVAERYREGLKAQFGNDPRLKVDMSTFVVNGG